MMTDTATPEDFLPLKEARLRRHLTQQRLAEMSGKSIATVRDLEQGKRRTVQRRTWDAFCEVLNVPGFSDLDRLTDR